MIDIDYLAQQQQNAVTGQNTNLRPTIQQGYADQRTALQTSTQAAKDAAMLGYNNQLSQLPQAYTAQSNQASINAAMRERVLREQMANMMLSGAGSTSRTLNQNNVMGLNQNLANIAMAKQNAINNLNTEMQQANLNLDAEQINAMAKLSAAEMSDLLAAEQFDRQMAFSEKEATFEKAWAMLNANRITAEQFEQMTGMTVSEARRRSSSSSTSTPRNDYLALITQMGLSGDEATALTGYSNVQSGDYARARAADDIVMRG